MMLRSQRKISYIMLKLNQVTCTLILSKTNIYPFFKWEWTVMRKNHVQLMLYIRLSLVWDWWNFEENFVTAVGF